MSDGSNYLDPNRPDAVRLSVSDTRALGEAALGRIITDQLIDNSLCGYRFAGLWDFAKYVLSHPTRAGSAHANGAAEER